MCQRVHTEKLYFHFHCGDEGWRKLKRQMHEGHRIAVIQQFFSCAAAVLSLNNMLPSVQCAPCLVSATCQQRNMTNKIRSIFITVLLAPCAIFSLYFIAIPLLPKTVKVWETYIPFYPTIQQMLKRYKKSDLSLPSICIVALKIAFRHWSS